MFLFNEDKAIHDKLSGIVVTDANSPDMGRPVGIIWLDGDTEVTKLTYPSIVICQMNLSRAEERESRGFIQLPYAPEAFPKWANMEEVTESPYWSQTPIPYNIDYQIQVLSRNNKHSTYLRAIMAGPDYLPTRFGYLAIPEDGTVRRLDLEAGPVAMDSKDSDGKRLLNSTYSIRVSTELLPQQIAAYVKVREVDIDYDRI